jgi:class 3 adenylate cyclase
MATQTLTFLFADVEGSAAMVRRLGHGGRAQQVFQLQAEDLPMAFRRCGRWRIRCC